MPKTWVIQDRTRFAREVSVYADPCSWEVDVAAGAAGPAGRACRFVVVDPGHSDDTGHHSYIAVEVLDDPEDHSVGAHCSNSDLDIARDIVRVDYIRNHSGMHIDPDTHQAVAVVGEACAAADLDIWGPAAVHIVS